MSRSLEILQELIQFETVSRRSNIALLDYAESLINSERANIFRVLSDDGQRGNLFITLGEGDGGILLSGHSDVVPIDGQNWHKPPFVCTVEDGKAYGRGTCDMKGFIACALAMFEKAARQNLRVPLHLALSYDEEIGCIGVRSLLERLQETNIKPSLCIIGEPTEMAVAIGHKGKAAFRARCYGKAAHSALATEGVNAIYVASDMIAALRDYQEHIRRSHKHDDAYDVPYSTVHVGTIKGGTVLNIVPEMCEFDFEIRNLADDDMQTMRKNIEKLRRQTLEAFPDEADIDISLTNEYPALSTDIDSDAVRFVQSLRRGNRVIKVAFGTEAGLFARDLSVAAVICGPGSMQQGHKADEFVSLEQLAACDGMLEALLTHCC